MRHQAERLQRASNAVVPTALIQAPNEIDSCPGTSITLGRDAQHGRRRAAAHLRVSANPRSTDNYYQVAAQAGGRGHCGEQHRAGAGRTR